MRKLDELGGFGFEKLAKTVVKRFGVFIHGSALSGQKFWFIADARQKTAARLALQNWGNGETQTEK